jgi:hypothetical protein
MALGPGQVGFLAVWINMLEADDWEAAKRAAEIYASFPHVRQFHDPHRRIGKVLAGSIQHPSEIAWDFYVFYETGVMWHDSAPRPHDWVHQLGQQDWPDQDRYRWGDDLRLALRSCMARMLD